MCKYEENSLFPVRILGMNNTGIGFGRLDDGMVLFVNGTVTGDVVTAKVIKVRKNLLIGRLEEITQRSPFRAADSFCAAPMPAADVRSGIWIMHMSCPLSGNWSEGNLSKTECQMSR